MSRRLGTYLRSFTGFERDARIFLLTTLVSGAAISLYWTDFNLYLAALGIERSTIGLIAAVGSLAGAVVAFPASGLSDRYGRRAVLVGGVVLMTLATWGSSRPRRRSSSACSRRCTARASSRSSSSRRRT